MQYFKCQTQSRDWQTNNHIHKKHSKPECESNYKKKSIFKKHNTTIVRDQVLDDLQT